MRQTTVHGVEIRQGDTCAHCHLDTAGQHEPGCPFHEDTVLAEADLDAYNQGLQEIDGTDIIWTPQGATLAKDYAGEYIVYRHVPGKGLVGRRHWSDGAGSPVGTDTQTMGV